MSLQFSGRKTFTPEEAAYVLQTILADYAEAVPEKNKAALLKAIQRGKALPMPGEFLYGMLYPDGKVKGSNPHWVKLAEHLKTHLPAGAIPKEGLPLVIKARDEKTFEAVKQYLETDLIPACQMKGDVLLPDGKTMPVFETVTWPFFKAIIAGEEIPGPLKPLAEKLAQLPVFQLLKAEALKPEHHNTLAAAYAPIKTRLSAVETARMQYSDRVDVKKVMGSFLKGALVGSSGELLIHNTIPEGTALAGGLRAGLLMGVEMVDSMYGQLGSLHGDLEANGMSMSKETIFGKPTWWQIIKNKFRMRGPGGLFAKRAAQSAIKGATLGCAVISVPVGLTISSETASVATRSLVGGVGSIGTSLSIPVNFRATLPQVYLVIRHMIQEGKIKVPEETLKDPKKLHRFARSMAEQELLSRIGFTSSMKAYTLVPLSGGILAMEYLGLPREVLQTIFMGVAPAMENLLRLVFTVKQAKINVPRKMAKVEGMILDAPTGEFTPKQKTAMGFRFADRWSRLMAKVVMFVSFRKVRIPKVDQVTLVQPKAPVPVEAKPLAQG